MSILDAKLADLERTEKAGAALLKDRQIDFAKWAMSPSEIAKLRRHDDWETELVDHFHTPKEEVGVTLPWSKTHINVRIRPGELSIWAGVNGHGKSMLLSQVILSFIKQGQTACIASLEMKPIATLARMARQCVGTEQPSPKAIQDFNSFLRGRLWIYDQQGTVQQDKMLAVLRYAREELLCDHFVIDSLMKCGINGDDYNAQKRFIDALSTYARDSDVHIHLVAHSRKRETEDKPMDKFDIKGSGDITDMADNVFALWRNKPKEEASQRGELKGKEADAPDALLVCDKQRHGDWEGRIGLWFNRRSLQYVGKQTTQSIDYLRGESA